MGRCTLNAVIFQLGWFCCVLSGSALALLYVCFALLLHFAFVAQKHQRFSELLVIVAVAAVGWCSDFLLIESGVVLLPDAGWGPPLWLLALWVLFASTLRHCMLWLNKSYLLTAVLGAVCGPLNYFAGAELAGGAIAQPHLLSTVLLMLTWLAVLPLLVLLANRIPRIVQHLGFEPAVPANRQQLLNAE